MNPNTSPSAIARMIKPKKALASLWISTPCTPSQIKPKEMVRAKSVVRPLTGLFMGSGYSPIIQAAAAASAKAGSVRCGRWVFEDDLRGMRSLWLPTPSTSRFMSPERSAQGHRSWTDQADIDVTLAVSRN
jgi:hypothetical protein